jgi:hypothetical protein
MKCTLKTVATLACGLLLAGSAFAFVEDKPAGTKFTPEQSQGQLSQQQGFNGQYGVVGDEQINQPKEDIRHQGGDLDAQSVIIGASPQATQGAVSALKVAESDVAHKGSGGPGRTVLWGLFFLVLGAFAVWAFRTYADKVVPEPPQKKSTKW